MLFTVDNNDDYFNDYFNLSNSNVNNPYDMNNSNVLSPKDGLEIGNLFRNEYDEYKNYKPRKLKPKNNQEADLYEIRALAFAVNDLNLKLDVDPNNTELFNLFKKYAKDLDQKVRVYSEKYDPLEVCLDTKDKYTWYKNPWPWEVDKYV